MRGAALPDQYPAFHQGAHALFQEEGIALRAGDQQVFERRQARVIPEESLEECLGTRRRQRVEPELAVVGFAAPAMLVLRPVVDQQQELGRRDALDQAIQEGLGLGVDPVEILTHQQQRLHLAFAQEEALEPVEGALAPLQRIECQERAVRG